MKEKVFTVLKKNPVYNLSCIYFVLPMIIFVLGWTRWFIAIPGTILMLACLWSLFKHAPEDDLHLFEKKYLHIWFVIAMILILWVYFSGIGGMTYQNPDHWWRNSIFRILVEHKWPVEIEATSKEGVFGTYGLIYYLGFWMPSALVGKIFGMWPGFLFQALWAFLGLFFFYWHLCQWRKKLSVWPLVVFIFFSGADVVGDYIMGSPYRQRGYFSHLEQWAGSMQFSSNTTLLFWVFNQAIVTWLILMILIRQKSNRYLVLMISFIVLTSTLPFIGILPIMLYFAFSRKYPDAKGKGVLGWCKAWAKDSLTWENILGGGFVGILSYIYLSGNASGQHTAWLIDTHEFRPYIMHLVMFLIFEVGTYMAAVYKYERKNLLYWLIALLFIFFPNYQIGFSSDFCMRASIPALMILCLMVIRTFDRAKPKKDWATIIALVLILLVGSVTPTREICRSINGTRQNMYLSVEVGEEQVMRQPNFTGDVNKSFFYKYLAKR